MSSIFQNFLAHFGEEVSHNADPCCSGSPVLARIFVFMCLRALQSRISGKILITCFPIFKQIEAKTFSSLTSCFLYLFKVNNVEDFVTQHRKMFIEKQEKSFQFNENQATFP